MKKLFLLGLISLFAVDAFAQAGHGHHEPPKHDRHNRFDDSGDIGGVEFSEVDKGRRDGRSWYYVEETNFNKRTVTVKILVAYDTLLDEGEREEQKSAIVKAGETRKLYLLKNGKGMNPRVVMTKIIPLQDE